LAVDRKEEQTMANQAPEEMRDLFFQFFTRYNLSLILGFYEELRAHLARRIAAIDEESGNSKGIVHGAGRAWEKSIVADVFDEQLRRTTFLLMYAHAEEWLLLARNTYAPSCELDARKGSIQRFKPVLVGRMGLDLSRDSNWRFLRDAESFRDCLLHANGRVSLLTKPQAVLSLAKRHNGVLEVTNDRLQIATPFLLRLKDAMEALISATTTATDAVL
jgi:hypothetical protein